MCINIIMSRALVLTGGGARSAYQIGTLKAIFELCKSLKIDIPFDIFCGTSAGAINASFLVRSM